MTDITTSTLACGTVLITERLAGVRSVGLSWLVPAGSARDPDTRIGLSALHAELILRGASDLDSHDQADAFDRLGVSRSSSVETHATTIRATMLGARVDDALPLITGMVREPRFDAEQFEPSRELCISAVEGLADDPQERVMVMLRRHHAPPPLNRAGVGDLEGLRAVTPEEVTPAWNERAVPHGSIIALAGDVDHDRIRDRLDALLDGWQGRATPVIPTGDPSRGIHHETDDTDQTHIALAIDAPSESEQDAWYERLLVAVMSGGMSGRLFTEIREKRSLVYSVWASYGADRDYGRTIAYAGTTPERAGETLRVLKEQFARLATREGAITADELRRAKVGFKSKLVFSGESSGARAAALATDHRKLGHARSLEELEAGIDSVTLEALNDYAARRSLDSMTVVSIGKGDGPGSTEGAG